MNSNLLYGSALVAMLLLFGMLGYFLYTFQTNIELFKNDPLKKGIELNKFDTCTCYRGQEIWFANTTSISRTIDSSPKFLFNRTN